MYDSSINYPISIVLCELSDKSIVGNELDRCRLGTPEECRVHGGRAGRGISWRQRSIAVVSRVRAATFGRGLVLGARVVDATILVQQARVSQAAQGVVVA